MREIKFRTWDGIRMTASGIQINGSNGLISAAADMPIMQFTGLLDKNGKEIYEGDILDWDSPIEVFYERGCFAVRGECFKGKVVDSHLLSGIEYQTNVIGNIYENPELIG